MNWYWVENNERRGPVNDEALQALVGSGRVGPETLVWRDGLAAWTPWRQVRPPEPAPAPAPPRPAPIPKPTPPSDDEIDPAKTVALSSSALMAAAAAAASREAAAAKPAAETESCTQCGRTFAKDDLMHFENDRVCAQCKPVYLQRLKEGVRPATQFVYAGFWVRFGAKIIDGFVLGIPMMAILFLFMPSFFRFNPGSSPPNLGGTCLVELVFYAVGIGYNVFFVGRFGATPGKMALKLRIVRPDGSPMTYGRALGRVFAEFVSAVILYIGYIMAAFDEEKRALHDRICDTRVVRA